MFSKDFYGTIYMRKSEKVAKNFYDGFLLFCIVIFLLTCIFNSIFFPAEVIGTSMQPTINTDYTPQNNKTDLVYASKLFGFSRGDIVLVDLPRLQDEAIKRLIAVGGDYLGFGDLDKIDEDRIYLNGKILIEDYLKGNSNIDCVNRFKDMIREHITNKATGYTVVFQDGMYQMKLDNDYCVFLGDNRDVSQDCSRLGPQNISSIHAKVFIHIPYGYNFWTYWSSRLFGHKF